LLKNGNSDRMERNGQSAVTKWDEDRCVKNRVGGGRKREESKRAEGKWCGNNLSLAHTHTHTHRDLSAPNKGTIVRNCPYMLTKPHPTLTISLVYVQKQK
jgi:hypothetical protein